MDLRIMKKAHTFSVNKNINKTFLYKKKNKKIKK